MLYASDKGFTLLNCAIIVFLVFIVLFYAVFLTINLYFFHLYRIESKIKHEYNKLINKLRWNNIAYLQTLSEKNEQLKQVLSQIIHINNFYDEQIKKVKEKIIKLTEYNRNFHFKQAKKLSKVLINDIGLCNKLSNVIQHLYVDATAYNMVATELIAKPRQVYDELKNFYQQKLTYFFENEEFNNFQQQISNSLIDANICLQKIDNDTLLNTLNNVNELLKSYNSLIRCAYIYSELLNYLNHLKDELDQNLANGKRKISENEYTNLLYTQSNLKTSLSSLAARIKKLEFANISLSITNIALQLHQALTLLNKYDRIILIIDNNLSFITTMMGEFNKNVAILNSFNESLKKYFNEVDTNNFTQSIENQILNLKKMNLRLDAINQNKENLNEIDHIKYLREIFDLLKNINHWVNNIDTTYNKISEVYHSTIELIDEIYDLQWTINQLLNFNNLYKLKYDEQTLSIIHHNQKLLDDILQSISSNFDINNHDLYYSIQTIKTDITNISSTIDINQQLKNYARALIVFGNKYRYEDESIAKNLDISQECYNQGEYSSAIDQLLPILTHIKDSASKNFVKFN